MKDFSIHPLSEDAVLIHTGHINQNIKVQNAIYQIERFPFSGLRELVPAYQTLTVYYDPFIVNGPFPFEKVKGHLETILENNNSAIVSKKKSIEIPVCYESDFGPDLNELAAYNNLSVEDAIHIHSSVVYEVMFIGFSPGFPFLAGLDNRLYFPRKTSPRLKVHQGSVGIAGQQTGIYSLDSPGGWQIIGRTPIKLFDIKSKRPTLLNAGDKVKFTPISQKEFYLWEDQLWE